MREAIVIAVEERLVSENKTCGPDGIHPSYLVRIRSGEIRGSELEDIIQSQIFKENFFETRLILLRKSKEDEDIKVRPIQVGNSIWRLSEKGMQKEITALLPLYRPEIQFGFSQGKNTHKPGVN